MIKRTLKRFSVGLLGVLFSLILMVVLTTWLLLGTATGNRWLLGQVSEWIPGDLQVEDWQGSLLDRVTVTGVHYQLDGVSVTLDRLEAELVPASLTRGWLEFTTLSLGDLRLSLPPDPKTEDTATAGLPDSLALPLGVRIDTLTLASLRLNDTQLVSGLDARQLAAWRRFQLASLTTRTVADISVEATAQGSLAAPMEIQGQARWQMPLAENETLNAQKAAGQLNIRGSLSTLILDHELSAPVQIHSQGEWQLADPERPLALEHQWPAQPLPLVLPQPLSVGDGRLTTRGPPGLTSPQRHPAGQWAGCPTAGCLASLSTGQPDHPHGGRYQRGSHRPGQSCRPHGDSGASPLADAPRRERNPQRAESSGPAQYPRIALDLDIGS